MGKSEAADEKNKGSACHAMCAPLHGPPPGRASGSVEKAGDAQFARVGGLRGGGGPGAVVMPAPCQPGTRPCTCCLIGSRCGRVRTDRSTPFHLPPVPPSSPQGSLSVTVRWTFFWIVSVHQCTFWMALDPTAQLLAMLCVLPFRYIFTDVREAGRGTERNTQGERTVGRLPPARPTRRVQPATRACALTGDRTLTPGSRVRAAP